MDVHPLQYPSQSTYASKTSALIVLHHLKYLRLSLFSITSRGKVAHEERTHAAMPLLTPPVKRPTQTHGNSECFPSHPACKSLRANG